MGEEMSLDAILIDLGDFGKTQILMYTLISLPIIFAPIYNTNYIFTAGVTTEVFRCLVPECEFHNSTVIDPGWLQNAMPHHTDSRRCSRFSPLTNGTGNWNTSCPASLFDNNTLIECKHYVFGSGESIVQELKIHCQTWKRTLIGTIHSIGFVLGMPLVAFVSDRCGRKVAFVSAAFFAGVFGVARSFSTNYIMFVILEFLEPLFGTGVYSTGLILGMELVSPKQRVFGVTILSMVFSFGVMLLGAIPWVIPYWRTFLRVIYTPSLLFISYYWLLQESVRWLISKGHYDKAVNTLKHAAKMNGVTQSEKSLNSLASSTEIFKSNGNDKLEATERVVSPLRQVLKSPIILCRLLKSSIWWITCMFVYYGLSINAVSLSGNIYLNYIFMGLVELPAYLTGYFTLNRFGRKLTLSTSYLCTGIACITFPFIPLEMGWLSLVVYLFGKYFITLVVGSLYVYTSELYPTPLRHSLLGICLMIGHIGTITAPQTPLLAEYIPNLPFFLFGGISTLSAFLMLTSPETLNIKLPDTIQEAESISKKKVIAENISRT